MNDYRRRSQCALCAAGGERLRQVLSLAPTPPANEFVRAPEPQSSIPLSVLLCEECGHAQLAEIVDPARLFGHYVYVSGTSPVFVAHFAKMAETAVNRCGLDAQSLVVDIGSNDGTLLAQFQRLGVGKVLGIDPASEIARDASARGIPTIEGFFSPSLAEELRASRGPAALITANNVFAHAEDLAGFGRGVKTWLAPEGVFMFEVSYLVDVLDSLLFDTIYHEHLSYHALGPLVRFFESLGLRVFDAERVDTHGGSLRTYVCRAESRRERSPNVDALLALEREMRLSSPEPFARLKQRISERGAEVRARVEELRRQGKRVAGFGAPAKLTTLVHEFGLGREQIDFVVDDSPWKQGLYTPGQHVPVVASSVLYERMPEACIVFAWNFADSIVKKHQRYIDAGGRFLVPLPELREIP